MRIEFSKMNGAGNDFIFIGPGYSPSKGEASELARKLCPRRTSVGADGLVRVDVSDGLFMHYCNSDGSEASFCGNGARCMVLFCAMKGIASGRIEFGTASGRHVGEITAGGVRVSMAPPRLEKELALDVGGTSYEIGLVMAGVPHAIVIDQHVDPGDFESVGRTLRAHPVFGEEGCNVDFVAQDDSGELTIRTYERGVEKETLACGSGCAAAAHLLRHKKMAGDEVTLRVASGNRLTVELPRSEGEDAYLVGPAAMVFEGHIEVDM